MKSRETLIRLSRFKTDEAKRKLSGLLAMRDDLLRKQQDLEHSLSDEQRKATESEFGRFAFPSFARAVISRRENLVRSVSEVERQIEAAREDVNTCFRDLKKYELAEEIRQRREDAEAQRVAQIEADDMAVTRFARQQSALHRQS